MEHFCLVACSKEIKFCTDIRVIIVDNCTSWLPHHWQLLQTCPKTPNFDENQKLRHVVCTEFREEFISGFDKFGGRQLF
jgi:hypothetical protein